MDEHLDSLLSKGWTILADMVDASLIGKLRFEMDAAYETCRSIQVKNGIGDDMDGTVHHLLCFEGAFLEFLEKSYCRETLSGFFASPFYILNTYGGVINLPNKASYVANIHRDIRTFYNVPMMINMLVMVDDFTLENGATYLLSKSHLKDEKPTEDFFYANAERAVGKAGSILLFDSFTWHAAGLNTTKLPRKALTLGFTRPFMKQQMDYPRFFGYERKEEFSDELKQLIGYNSRVPASLDEWYQPPAKRFYKPGQG